MPELRFDRIELFANGLSLFPPLSAQVPGGETLCVVGPSGSGKSSLLKFACGFLPGDIDASGRVFMDDVELTHLPASDRRLGLLFQDAVLFPHLSVGANVAFGLREGDSRRARRTRVGEALASVGLGNFAERDPATLSGGQRARVALLRVLLSEPQALLLDEPFSALDRGHRGQVRDLVLERARELGLPVVLVTHDSEDVSAAGGQVITLTQDGS